MSDVPTMRVRMYRHGLGDCFLLTIEGDGPAFHVLIDCGVLLGTKDAVTTMRTVARDIATTTGGRLDAVVATHEHWDHVSGFVQAQDVFAGVTIGQAWLAWTEKPDDEQANRLRAARERTRTALAAAGRAAVAAAPDAGPGRARALLGLAGFTGELAAGDEHAAAGRALRTAGDAMRWIARTSVAPPRYVEPGTSFAATPGVRVFVLAPPRDERMLRKDLPSTAHPETYELAADTPLPAGGPPPFEAADAVDALDGALRESYDRDPWRRIDHDWLDAADALALKLDSDTNNTSVVLAFELGAGGPVLLFPGDAQVGNWLSWDALEFVTEQGPVTAADLLGRTVLYKVGHHGSHNATLKERGLELMTSPDLVAMIPVDHAMAQQQEWRMPLPGLLTRLTERTRGRVLDATDGLPARPAASDGTGLDDAEWAAFRADVDVTDLRIDLTLRW